MVGLVHKSSRLYEVSSLLDYLAPPKQISELKAELFGLLKFGIVVTVFTNNSVVVVNLQ